MEKIDPFIIIVFGLAVFSLVSAFVFDHQCFAASSTVLFGIGFAYIGILDQLKAGRENDPKK